LRISNAVKMKPQRPENRKCKANPMNRNSYLNQ
jgi:hypothetical protein